MDWNRIEDDWASFKLRIAIYWPRLKAERLEAVAGDRERLLAALQEAYGMSRQETDEQLANWQASQRETERMTPSKAALVFSSGAAGAQQASDARWSSYRDFWFDYYSTRIDAADSGNVADVANHLRQHPSYRVGIDAAMDPDSALRKRRVEAVRDALINAGVPNHKIQDWATAGRPTHRRALCNGLIRGLARLSRSVTSKWYSPASHPNGGW